MQQRHNGGAALARSSSGDLSVSSVGSVGIIATVLGSTTTNTADSASAAAAAAAAAVASRNRRRTRRRGEAHKNKSASMAASAESSSVASFNWVFTFLVLGLFFCLMDAVYIMRFLMVRGQFDDSIGSSSSSSSSASLSWATATVRLIEAEATTATGNVSTNNNNNDNNNDNDNEKDHILHLLAEAGITDLDDAVLAKLPAWSDVTALYGTEPVILGWDKDVCRAFQESGDAGDHFLAVAGTFNTGTNLMAELLIANCHMPARMAKWGDKNRGVRWQVLWGKHTPVGDNESFRQGHRTYNDSSLTADNIFPAVTVRDPFKWMQSMCRHEYGAHWHHNESHCPNLVPNQVERDRGWILPDNANGSKNDTIPVSITYSQGSTQFTRYHSSLVDFWNSWYQEYTQASFPKLIVRFEDLVFHPKQVTQQVCECAGGAMNEHPFKYIVDSAKKGDGAHGTHKTSYVDALVKYGTEKGRYKGMTDDDLRFAKQNLDPALMKMFGYPYPSPTNDKVEREIA